MVSSSSWICQSRLECYPLVALSCTSTIYSFSTTVHEIPETDLHGTQSRSQCPPNAEQPQLMGAKRLRLAIMMVTLSDASDRHGRISCRQMARSESTKQLEIPTTGSMNSHGHWM